MYMMFSQNIRRIDFGKVMPYNDIDMMYLVSPRLALRLENITAEEEGRCLGIKVLMENQEIFQTKNFDERFSDFLEIVRSRIERYFFSKKSIYIFFDQEEQRFLRKLTNDLVLNCRVQPYRITEDFEFEKINVEDMTEEEYREFITVSGRVGVHAVMPIVEYTNLKRERSKHAKQARERFKKRAEDMRKKEIDVYFKKYPKLSKLDEKSKVDKYFKLLLKKFHPDAGGDEETFKLINTDLEYIKNTSWYKELE